ncbi:ly6/PLAUR domain-containing protein 6 isoform X1 [Manis javanica]|uniref:ly6/PLAUR domain-containing protein 6 isoform X1 n=1 Tax=Manis javanica TaxID=9974 RepID=UPI000813B2B3
MDPGPALAWLLLLSLLADCLKAAQSRDFTVKDIIYLHPSRLCFVILGNKNPDFSLLGLIARTFSFHGASKSVSEGDLGRMSSARPEAHHSCSLEYATPYPGGFKCFTCEKAADNYECNRWAPDIYCPRETRYCYTQHTMEVTGNSISVTKRCVALEECLSTGCRDSEHEGHKVCTSCCEGNICNLPLPRNETDATFATTSPINQTNGRPHCVPLIVTCLWVLLAITS